MTARRLLIEAPPSVLAVVAEGAWIALVALLLQTARREPSSLGIVLFAAFAAVGLVVARAFAARLEGHRAWVVIAMALVAAVAGWLLGEVPRAALARGDLQGALSAHQSGFLAGLALLRGTSHAIPMQSEKSLARLLAWGTPLLALPLLIAQSFDEPIRSTFEGSALVLCLAFLLAATLGLALARVANLGRSAGFDWQRNRVWLLVAVTAALVTVVALPLAFFVGPAVRLAIALTLPPLLLVALVVGLGTVTIRAVTIVALVGVIVFALSRIAFNFASTTPSGGSSPTAGGPNGQDPTATLLTWLPIIAVALLLLVVLVRRWLRRRPTTAAPAVREQRWTEPPGDGRGLLDGLHWPWTWRRRGATPTSAVEAYLATLDDLDRDRALARAAAESPAAHARRLRAAGDGSRDLDLLAADYQLARFGEVELSAPEERRAVRRWRRLRRRWRG
jgi:hypothetical protein